MEHQESTFNGYNGIALYAQAWLPEARPRAAVALVHGFGEHSGRYANLVAALLPRGYAVHAYDLRGHGRSPGQRGLIMAWDEYREDTRAFLGTVRTAHPDVPSFLYGHSLGGLIVLDFVLHDPGGLRGVIASGPTLGPPAIAPILVAISRVLSSIAPRFSLEAGLEKPALSRDPAVPKAYAEDPLVHGRASARLGTELTRTLEWVNAHAGELRLPLLLLHGAADRIAPPAFSKHFFENVGGTDKTFLSPPGGFHEPHNDIDHAAVLAEVEAWIARHL